MLSIAATVKYQGRRAGLGQVKAGVLLGCYRTKGDSCVGTVSSEESCCNGVVALVRVEWKVGALAKVEGCADIVARDESSLPRRQK